MDALFLVAYVVLPLVALWRSRSIAWTVIMTVASVSILGAVVGFVIDHVMLWTRVQLQLVLLLALLVPALLAFVRRPSQLSPRRHQVVAVLVPVGALTAFFAVMTTWWTEGPAYLNPVSFLMGHSLAEDNAKWLDFTSVMAAGVPMEQFVPMGGPLQLFLVFVGTLMGVVSAVTLGGYNEVMVAANTVVYAQFMMVVIAPFALVPLVEARMRRPVTEGVVSGKRVRLPWPLVWLGALVFVLTNLMLTAYGHLTLQFTILVCSLWVTTFLTWVRVPRALLLTSMAVAAGMTVWLPMNAIAGVLVVGWLAYLVARAVRGGRPAIDWVGFGVVLVVAVSIWEPMRSSLAFVLASTPSAAGAVVSGLGGGVHAAVGVISSVPGIGNVLAGLTDSTLFAAGGGTEQTTAILAGLAAVGTVGTAVVVSRQQIARQAYVRFLPILLLAGFAVTLNVLDQWATGSAPHYGSLKFTFMVAIVLIGCCVPLALLLLDPKVSGMTLGRWVGLGAVIFLLTVDSLLVRSVAAARPTQWSPPIPFDNPQSYWWPADVNGTATQPIAENPVACVYLPQGAAAPSAILESQLSDAQRVYSCSRLLAGLASEDGGAQPIVDWLRREWLANTRAWTDVHGYLSAMPDSVLDKSVILLDDGSNVIGLETMRALLARYPAEAGQRW
ncbi:MAG: hypothetical protein K9G28_10210 [Candidatus Nanopelagicales bacterium]|nr:hypothetical protein [Candidatus Nanopelagicales bacterium]MCF8557898.1 hypothetical protein [Candidatus Nanopelagicales bacterium]